MLDAVFETPTNWWLIGHAVWLSALYAAPLLLAAWLVFRRRDVATRGRQARDRQPCEH